MSRRGFIRRRPGVIPQPRVADPPRYLFVGGHPYMLASHAGEQMERCMSAARPLGRVVQPFSIVAEEEPV